MLVKIERGNVVIGEAEATSVERNHQPAKEVIEGELCGLRLKTKTKLLLQEGDRLTFLRRELVKRKLS